MVWFLTALGLILLSGLAAVPLRHRSPLASAVAVGGLVAGSVVGIVPALLVLNHGESLSLRWAWAVPFGAFSLELDPLAAFFLVPIFLVSALAGVYGRGYLGTHRNATTTATAWFGYNLLTVSMALVVTAHNAVLFLAAWELMTLASWALVTLDDEDVQVRQAGRMYLVAMHIGTACLLAMFLLLGRGGGSLDFGQFIPIEGNPTFNGWVFVLAVLGFGMKAGFVPLHIWLPEAHPAAPSHVSAVMSGVMIKTGIYGLLRTLSFLGAPPWWWGALLIGIGLSSGLFGILFSLSQHDLKRLLAYSSVENIGVIALGMGLGMTGMYANLPALTVLGFGGALLHVLNHALFKSALFLGAGAVAHTTGTRNVEHLGGLLRRMPWTATAFFTGSTAVCGLPPLNGFVSEFLIYLGAFAAVTSASPGVLVAGISVIFALALIGGLAAACFTKAFGMVFLGEPRTEAAIRAVEAPLSMRVPMLALAGCCVLVGLTAPVLVQFLVPVLVEVTGQFQLANLFDVRLCLAWVLLVCMFLLAAVSWLWGRAMHSLAGRPVIGTVTWDCGYEQPTPRMQYTAASFAQPLVTIFRMVLRSKTKVTAPAGVFPQESRYATETRDVVRESWVQPLFLHIRQRLEPLRWLQHGRLHLYVLYIALTLLILLFWKL